MRKKGVFVGVCCVCVYLLLSVVTPAYGAGWSPVVGNEYTQSDGPSTYLCSGDGRVYEEIALRFKVVERATIEYTYYDNTGKYIAGNRIFLEKDQTTDLITGCVFFIRQGKVRIEDMQPASNMY